MMRTVVLRAKKILFAPLSGANWYKKILLWPFVVFLGLPLYLLAFCLAVLPLLLGGGLLLLQSFLYLETGKWPSFSILDAATHTVEPSLADEIGEPQLATCGPFRDRLIPGGDGRLSKPCPDLSSWQFWLIQPGSWFGLHEMLLPFLNLASIPLLLLLKGLFFRSLFKQLHSNVLADRGPLQIQPQH
ncbi:MAG: hypothetical protein ACRD88_13135 [Terriglobia bacterium]